ncbi:MAG: hypothetical protein NT085_00815 [candidate division SR1 bacterium]|nr:hypothetical protein [candidate division SR1 bacterium]
MSTTTGIDELQTQVDQVSTDLASLKTETNETIKKTKIEEAAVKVKTTKELITKEIDALKGLTDTISIENKAKLEKMFTTLETLETSNTDLATLKADVNKNWITKQRDGVISKEEWKTNTGANILRVAGGIGAVALAWKGVKWLFGIGKDKEKKKEDESDKDDKEESKEKSGSSWRKWLLGGAALTAGGYGLYHLLKGGSLSFEDSLIEAEADLGTISESDEINIDRGRITYEKSVKQIKSYELGTKIDKGEGWFGSKKIEGLDIKFSDYKQLIHAANLVNYIKHKFTGRCKTDTPFHAGDWTGDYYIDVKSGDGDIEEEEIISGGIFSTLSKICPDLLNGIFTDTINKDKFLAYLNKQGIWKEGNVTAPDAKGDKIQKTMNKIFQEIIDTPSEFDPLGKERGQIITTPGNTDKTEYTIKSRGTPAQETKVDMVADADGTIISGKIDGLEIKFATVKELLKTANLVNKIKYQYHVVTPLLLGPTDKAFYRTSSFGVVGGHPGIYVDNSTAWTLDDRVIKKDTLESSFPTVLISKDVFIAYLNGLKDENDKGLWEK